MLNRLLILVVHSISARYRIVGVLHIVTQKVAEQLVARVDVTFISNNEFFIKNKRKVATCIRQKWLNSLTER